MYQSMWYAPAIGKGAARPYIGTICFLSALILEQGEMDKPVVGVGNDTSPTPAPPVSECTCWKQNHLGQSTSISTGSTPETSPDQPAPLQTWHSNHQEPTSLEVLRHG